MVSVMIGWMLSRVVLYFVSFVSAFMLLLPMLVIMEISGAFAPAKELVFLALVGYTATNFGVLLRISREEFQKLSATVLQKKTLLAVVIMLYVDFLFAIGVASLFYPSTEAALLIPLMWFSLEKMLSDRGFWFLSPAAVIARIWLRPSCFVQGTS